MAVKRKTDTNANMEEVLEGQIPEFSDAPNVDEHAKIEAEIRARVEAEMKRREQENSQANLVEQPEPEPEIQSASYRMPKIGERLTHQFGFHDEGQRQADAEMIKTKNLSGIGENIKDKAEIREGWIPVDRALLGERSFYYPERWEFLIKPASVDAIRNWSMINEENPFSVSDVFNEILKYCLKINTPTGPQPWSSINVWDKLTFILLIREYTFKSGEQNIQFTEDCVNCDSPVEFKLDSQSLMFDMPDEDVLKYYDREKREWYINPEEYDIPYDALTLYNPTVEKDMNIQSWLLERYQENKNYKPDSQFIKFLSWLAPKISKDSTIAKRQIKEYQLQYKSWDMDMFGFMEDVIRNIMITPGQNLSAICPSCGEEVTAQIRFPNGIGDLFNVRNKEKRFGPK